KGTDQGRPERRTDHPPVVQGQAQGVRHTLMPVAARPGVQVAVERLEVTAYTIPLEEPESDGTLEWDSLTCVVVRAHGGGETGLGYTYGADSIAHFVRSKLAEQVEGADAFSPQSAWASILRAIRNFGQEGLGAMAVSAVEI